MIPVAYFSGTFYLLLLLGVLAVPTLLIWGGLLALFPSVRQSFKQHRKKCVLALLMLLLPASFAYFVWYVGWSVERDHERERLAREMVLPRAATIAQIDMPAGTRLQLRHAHEPRTFTSADFPVAAQAMGVQATRVKRFLRDSADGSDPYPVSASVTLAHDQTVAGWRCTAGHPVEFGFRDEANAAPVFERCQLAAGTRIGPWELPAGAIVRHTGNTVYLDGTRDDDEWAVGVEGEASGPVQVLGLTLDAGTLHANADRQLVGFDGMLAAEQEWRGVRYPAGTRVKMLGGALRERFGKTLAFSPVEGQVVRRPGQRDVTFGYTLLHRVDGRVLAVVPNGEVGVLEFRKFLVD